MPRDTTNIAALIGTADATNQTRGASVAWLVTITLPPAASESVPLIARIADKSVTVSGFAYVPRLREVGKIEFSEGSANDGTDLQIENASGIFGGLVSDLTRTLDGATAKLSRAFLLASGAWEAKEMLRGELSDVKIDGEFVRLRLNSELSLGIKIGGEQLTQRCLYKFNVGGLPVLANDPRAACGWLLAQGGDPTACDHTLDGANGCRAHNNVHRFSGVPELEANAAFLASGGGTRDIGDVDDNGFPRRRGGGGNERDPRLGDFGY